MGPPSPLQSPARSSQTWSTRFSLTRNLTPRSSENAPPRSVRWTEKTAQRQTKKRKRRSRLWSTAWPVRGGAVIITPGFLIQSSVCSPQNANQRRPHFHSHPSAPTTNIPRISILSHEVRMKSQMQSKALPASLCWRVQDILPVSLHTRTYRSIVTAGDRRILVRMDFSKQRWSNRHDHLRGS